MLYMASNFLIKIVEEQRIFYPRDVLASFLVYVKIFLFLLIDALMCIFCLERKFILELGVIGVSKPIPFLIVWSTKANSKQETYKLHLWLGDEDSEYLFEDFRDELSTVTNNYRLDQKRHEIVISNLTAGNIGLILKSIRNYLREHGIIKYMLKLER